MTQNKIFFILKIGLIFGLILLGMKYWTTLYEFQPISEEIFPNNMVSRPILSTQKVVSTQSYIERGPISISSNTHLKLNFPGEGTIDDPVRIEGYNITPAIGYSHLIEIRDTTVHFRIVDNLLNGNATATFGIYLENVNHGIIENNFVYNNSEYGIILDSSSSNNTVVNNTIYDNDGDGIYLGGSNCIIANNTVYGHKLNWSGIYVGQNNINNIITNNTIYNNDENGITIDKAHNNTLSYNMVYSCLTGIAVIESDYTTISHNIIFDAIDQAAAIAFVDDHKAVISNNIIYNYLIGIGLESSSYNILTDNTIYNTDEDGIGLGSSDHNTIANNLVFDNDGNGINLWDSRHNTISNNTVFNNNNDGIILGGSHNHIISNNTVYDCPRGITLWYSNNNIISNNKVYNCLGPGISLWHDYLPSHNNTITGNNFLSNNPWGNSQASDEGSNNVFRYNVWNDWTGPDTNGDGVVDKPYVIDGSVNNQDNYPLVSFTHFLSFPSISSPIGGETLSGKVLIEWASAFDLFNHPVTYTVYYSSDEGATWTQLITGLTTTSYSWDTNTIPDGFSYLIKVNATCSEDLSREDISDGTFTIQNAIPTTLTTSISTTSVSSPGLTGIILLLSFFTLITVKRKFLDSR